MPEISLHNVTYRYPNQVVGLDAVSLKFPQGERIALLGANGAGKTTLMLLLTAILKPSIGEMRYNKTAYRYHKKALTLLRKNIGMLFHNPDHQLFAPTVFEEVAFGISQLSSNKELIVKTVEKALNTFQLNALSHLPPHKLSTGQKKRVALAAVVAMQPELLICDEPTANLDPHQSNNLFAYLDRINQKGTTILISTHNVDRAYEWADTVIILDKGKVAAQGKPTTLFRDKALLEKCGLQMPKVLEIYLALNKPPNLYPPKNIHELKQMITNNRGAIPDRH